MLSNYLLFYFCLFQHSGPRPTLVTNLKLPDGVRQKFLAEETSDDIDFGSVPYLVSKLRNYLLPFYSWENCNVKNLSL